MVFGFDDAVGGAAFTRDIPNDDRYLRLAELQNIEKESRKPITQFLSSIDSGQYVLLLHPLQSAS